MISKTIGFRGLAYFQTHPYDGGFLDQQNPRTTAEKLMLMAARQTPVTAIQSSSHAFAALLKDGSVTTWGNKDYGGDPWKFVEFEHFWLMVWNHGNFMTFHIQLGMECHHPN